MGFLGEIREAVEIAQKADNVDLYRQMLDVQRQAQELYEENLELRERVAELEKQEKIKEQLEFDKGVYWRFDEEGERHGPYCQLCADRDQMLIRLQDYKNGYFGCQSCQNTVDHPAATDSGSDPPVWRGRG